MASLLLSSRGLARPNSSRVGDLQGVEHTLKRCPALLRYLDNALMPIDNNWIENAIRPVAVGRKNWLFVGSTSLAYTQYVRKVSTAQGQNGKKIAGWDSF
ncbi:transposase [Serratia symbiotica]|nr:transposase [Serratia symbiotica]